MTLDTFITKYNGKKVEYHSYSSGALYQCTDLANQYIVEVLNLTPIIGTNAQDFPTKRGNEFNWIINTPDALPTKGALMIFKSTDGVGHISIFVEGNLNLFRSFDQNYPTGSPCKIVQHNYRNVLGWLTPIMPEKTYTQAEWQTERDERNKNWDLFQNEKADHEATKSELTEVRTSHNQFLQTLATKLVCLADEANIIGTIDRLLEVEDQLTKARKDYSQLEKEKFLLESDKNREIERLGDELSELRRENIKLQSKTAEQALAIDRLDERIEELLTLPKEKPEMGQQNGLSRLIKSIISSIRKILWLK